MSPKIAKYLYLLSIGFLFYRGPKFGLVKYADIAIILAAGAYLISYRRKIRLPATIPYLLTTFFLSMLISLLHSPLPLSSNSIFDIFRYVLVFVLFGMTFHYVSTAKIRFTVLRNTFLLAGLPSISLSIGAFALFQVGYTPVWVISFLHRPTEARTMPLFYDPNHYGSVVTIGYLFACHYAIAHLRKEPHSVLSVSIIILPALFAFAAFTTGSRTAIGVVFTTTILLTAIFIIQAVQISVLRHVLPSAVVFGVLLLIGYQLWLPDAIQFVLLLLRLDFRNGGVLTSLNIRYSLWKGAFRTWIDHPLFGVGPNNYIHYIPYLPDEWRPERANYPHNMYLGLLAELGVTGFILAGTIIGITAKRVSKVAFHWPTSRNVITFTLLLAMLEWGFFLDIFTSRRLWFIFGLAHAIGSQEIDSGN
ncbi:O-antigen ligase family protein [Halomarina pelagica]|uniref:O-antigen ligase family protein n=1 Tax=Halomarina pelagica TaxID=2961599 RepID=UPI0020C2314C|nr:O-antigen ligase family protein [Halomarina sp. BND7]